MMYRWVFASVTGIIFELRFALNISLKVCQNNFNQGTIVPDNFFKYVPHRDEKISNKVWLKKSNRSLL